MSRSSKGSTLRSFETIEELTESFRTDPEEASVPSPAAEEPPAPKAVSDETKPTGYTPNDLALMMESEAFELVRTIIRRHLPLKEVEGMPTQMWPIDLMRANPEGMVKALNVLKQLRDNGPESFELVPAQPAAAAQAEPPDPAPAQPSTAPPAPRSNRSLVGIARSKVSEAMSR